MKITQRIAILVILFFAAWGENHARAASISPPPGMCGEGAGCTAAMVAISRQFDSLKAAPDVKYFPEVLSGECYYLGFGTDPTVTQYGLELFDSLDGKPADAGLLSFFASPSDYNTLTVEEARVLLEKEGSSLTPLELSESLGLAEVEFTSTSGSIQYWFREDSVTSDVIELGLWNLRRGNGRSVSEVFCRLRPNL